MGRGEIVFPPHGRISIAWGRPDRLSPVRGLDHKLLEVGSAMARQGDLPPGNDQNSKSVIANTITKPFSFKSFLMVEDMVSKEKVWGRGSYASTERQMTYGNDWRS